jgi:hypothetical protein
MESLGLILKALLLSLAGVLEKYFFLRFKVRVNDLDFDE